MAPDDDRLDEVAKALQAIAEAAQQRQGSAMLDAAVGDQPEAGAPVGTNPPGRSFRLDVVLLGILAAPSFEEQAALHRLVTDALRD